MTLPAFLLRRLDRAHRNGLSDCVQKARRAPIDAAFEHNPVIGPHLHRF
jgi:hypothetical protein